MNRAMHHIVEFINRPGPFCGTSFVSSRSSLTAGLIFSRFCDDIDLALQQQLDCSGFVVARASERAPHKIDGESHGKYDAIVASEWRAAMAVAFKRRSAT